MKVKNHVLPLLLLGLLAALFLSPALRPGYTLVPPVPGDRYPWHGTNNPPAHDPQSDTLLQFYPFRHYFTEVVRRGELPLWNPHVFGGHPLLGDAIAQPFYPLNWLLAYLFSAGRALSVAAFIHTWLAGALMYGYVCLITGKRFGALVSALTFTFSGVSVVWLSLPQFQSTGVWIAGVLLFYELALRRRRWAYAAVAGLCLGVQILGGQSQYFLYSAMLVAGYAAFRIAPSDFRSLSNFRSRGAARCAPTLLMGIVGLGIGAVQLFPALELATFSHREPLSYAKLASVHFPWRHLVTYVAPNFYGTPVDGTFWGDITYVECMAYFGILPLILALAAPFVARHKYTYFFYGAGILALLIALGTPFLRLVYWVPGFNYFYPHRIVYLVVVCGAILAGFAAEELVPVRVNGQIGKLLMIALGVAYVIQRPPQASRYVLPAAMLLLFSYLVLSLFVKYHSRRAAQILLIAFVLVDLGTFGFNYNSVSPIADLYPPTALTTALARDTAIDRTILLQPRDAVLMGPNVPLIFHLYDTSGYTSTFINRYREFIYGMDSRARHLLGANTNTIVFDRVHPRLLQLLNIKYILAVDAPEQIILADTAAASQLTCDGTTEKIWGIHTAGQTFTTAYAGLNRVDVRFVDVPHTNTGEIAFHLLHAVSAEHLAYVKINVADIPDSGIYTFYFTPQSDSANRQYYFFLDAPDVTDEADAIHLCLALRQTSLTFATYSYPTAVWRSLGIYDGVTVYENPDYLPRAWIAHQARVIQDDAEILTTLKSPAFNPATTVILETAEVGAQRAAPLRLVPADATVEITRYTATQIDLRVTTDYAGYLVLSEIYYPGWTARVDGESRPIYRANYTFRAIPISAGTYDVQVRFEPLSFKIGAGISLVTLTGVVLWGLSEIRGSFCQDKPSML